MKFWMLLAVPVLVLGIVGIVDAAGRNAAANKLDSLHGKVLSVAADGSSIVIKEGKKQGGQELTVQTNAGTAVTIDRVSGKHVSDLVPGDRVKVYPATGVATKILARIPHHHGKHGAAPAQAEGL
jgi:hypothetical protein